MVYNKCLNKYKLNNQFNYLFIFNQTSLLFFKGLKFKSEFVYILRLAINRFYDVDKTHCFIKPVFFYFKHISSKGV